MPPPLVPLLERDRRRRRQRATATVPIRLRSLALVLVATAADLTGAGAELMRPGHNDFSRMSGARVLQTIAPTPTRTLIPSPSPSPSPNITVTPSPSAAPTTLPTPAPVPTTGIPTPTTATPLPTTPQSTSPRPTSPSPTAPAPTPPRPTTPRPTAPSPTAPRPTSPQPTSPSPTSPLPTTQTPAPTTATPSPPTPSSTSPTTTPPTPTPTTTSPTPTPTGTTPSTPTPSTSEPKPTIVPSHTPWRPIPTTPTPTGPTHPTDDDQAGPVPPKHESPAPVTKLPPPPPPPTSSTSSSPLSTPPLLIPSPPPAPPSPTLPETESPSPPVSAPPSPSPTTVTLPPSPLLTPAPLKTPQSPETTSPSVVTTGQSSDRLSSSAEQVYTFLGHASAVFGLASTIFLAILHLLASDGRFCQSTWALEIPKSWEFVIYIGYVQGLASIAHVIAPMAPPFLLRYVDSFSWTIWMPFHGDHRSDRNEKKRLLTEIPRRLSSTTEQHASIAPKGLDAFAIRIGVAEQDLLHRSLVGFAVVLACAVVGWCVFVVVQRYRATQRLSDISDAPTCVFEDTTTQTLPDEFTYSSAHVFYGICVLLWLLSLYPMVLVSSSEIATELRTGHDEVGKFTLAIITLVVLCLGMSSLAVVFVASLRAPQDASCRRNQLVWGALYASMRHERRLAFVLFLATQILLGVTIGVVASGGSQLGFVIAMNVLFLFGIGYLRPFQPGTLATEFTLWACLARSVNAGFVVAFQGDGALSAKTRRDLAIVFVVVNSILIFAWFLRHFGILCRVIRIATGESRWRWPSVKLSSNTGHSSEDVLFMPMASARPPELDGGRTVL